MGGEWKGKGRGGEAWGREGEGKGRGREGKGTPRFLPGLTPLATVTSRSRN